MILCNAQIQVALDAGRLVIRPEPLPRQALEGQYCPYDTHSVDLTLAPEISIPTPGPYCYDVMQPGTSLAEFLSTNSKKQRIDETTGFALAKNQFILARTRETIALPIPGEDAQTCLAARIEGKSSRARCGVLVHFTAPTVHPGFEGSLTLEMINLGPVPFILRTGMPIAQLIVEEVRGIPFWNQSQFQGQNSPEGMAQP
jgi:dCTP deaminase